MNVSVSAAGLKRTDRRPLESNRARRCCRVYKPCNARRPVPRALRCVRAGRPIAWRAGRLRFWRMAGGPSQIRISFAGESDCLAMRFKGIRSGMAGRSGRDPRICGDWPQPGTHPAPHLWIRAGSRPAHRLARLPDRARLPGRSRKGTPDELLAPGKSLPVKSSEMARTADETRRCTYSRWGNRLWSAGRVGGKAGACRREFPATFRR